MRKAVDPQHLAVAELEHRKGLLVNSGTARRSSTPYADICDDLLIVHLCDALDLPDDICKRPRHQRAVLPSTYRTTEGVAAFKRTDQRVELRVRVEEIEHPRDIPSVEC